MTLRAAGCSGGGGSAYEITICYVSNMTATQRTAFTGAAARWGSLVTGDLSDVSVSRTSICGTNSYSLNMTVDDVLILASTEAIDGPGGVLGEAGPCAIRSTGKLTTVGTMRFDIADLNELEADGQLTSTILHEMGHVLGIGLLWSTFNLLQNPSPVEGPPLDSYFSGANAIAEFNAIGGFTYTGGQKVPVENGYSAGTINVHWRESVLANELMTGFLNPGSNPLSVLTVRSLQDLGYTVNTAGADPFFLALSLRAQGAVGGPGREFINDVYTGPMYTIDASGKTVRIR